MYTQLILNASIIACFQVKKPDGSGQHCRVEKKNPKPPKVAKRAKSRAPVIDDDSDFLTETSSNAEVQQYQEVDEPDLWAASEEDEVEADKKGEEDEYGDVDVDQEDDDEMSESLKSSSKASDLNDVNVTRVGDGVKSIWRGEISEDDAEEEIFQSARLAKRLRVDDDPAEFKVIDEAPANIQPRIILSKPRRPLSDDLGISCLTDNSFEKMVSCVNFFNL